MTKLLFKKKQFKGKIQLKEKSYTQNWYPLYLFIYL